jgi:hypothetical protein
MSFGARRTWDARELTQTRDEELLELESPAVASEQSKRSSAQSMIKAPMSIRQKIARWLEEKL